MPARRESLSEAQLDALLALVSARLREAELSPPLEAEREPTYTARCLTPQIHDVLDVLGIHGLVPQGEGGAPVAPVALFGLRFYPDLTITFHQQKVLAIEVKYLRNGAGRENAVATCLGQAYLYRQAGYPRTSAFLVDTAGILSDQEIKRAEEVCRSGALDLVIRRRVGARLVPHPV